MELRRANALSSNSFSCSAFLFRVYSLFLFLRVDTSSSTSSPRCTRNWTQRGTGRRDKESGKLFPSSRGRLNFAPRQRRRRHRSESRAIGDFAPFPLPPRRPLRARSPFRRGETALFLRIEDPPARSWSASARWPAARRAPCPLRRAAPSAAARARPSCPGRPGWASPFWVRDRNPVGWAVTHSEGTLRRSSSSSSSSRRRRRRSANDRAESENEKSDSIR